LGQKEVTFSPLHQGAQENIAPIFSVMAPTQALRRRPAWVVAGTPPHAHLGRQHPSASVAGARIRTAKEGLNAPLRPRPPRRPFKRNYPGFGVELLRQQPCFLNVPRETHNIQVNLTKEMGAQLKFG
jgi:hypothetical protein